MIFLKATKNIFLGRAKQSLEKIEMNDTIKQWSNRLAAAQTGHYIAAERYILINRFIGIPLVASSTFVSAFLFFESDEFSDGLSLTMKILSIFVALLASLQTLMRPTEKAEAHRSCASKYGSLKRRIERFSTITHKPEDWTEFSKEIIIEWSGIADNAPTTPQRLRNKATVISAKSG